MPRGGIRQGAGRKPYPDFKPEGIVIDVRDMTAHVARWVRVSGGFQLQPADNVADLYDAAALEVAAAGGALGMSGIYPCSPELAARAMWKVQP